MKDLIIVVDFEATCSDDHSINRHDMEIIEFGANIANIHTGEIISEFQAFVRPVINPELTYYCKDLTKITQEDVDSADLFEDVYNDFLNWINEYDVSHWGSWGKFDKNILDRHLVWSKIKPNSILINHINLKKMFMNSTGLKLEVGLGKALFHANLRFEGTQHRAIDDANNISRLLPRINFSEVK